MSAVPWYLKPTYSRSCCGTAGRPCWRVRCGFCGKVVSKHDFTLEDTVACGEEHVREVHGAVNQAHALSAGGFS